MVTVYEATDSRRFTQDRNGGGLTARFIVGPSSDEQAVRAAVVLDTTVSYWGTLFRSAIRINPRGGNFWDVEVDYAPIPPGEAIQAPGFQPGDQPAPVAPDINAPLGPGYSMTTAGGTTKIIQSLRTRSRARSLEAIAKGWAQPDYLGAINPGTDTVEGVDIVSRTAEWSIDVRRPVVTLNYFSSLFYLTGTVNAQPFYGFAAGEVLYLGAELRYAAPEWSITHKFSVSPNEVNKVLARDKDGVATLTIAEKRGWDYVWVGYVYGEYPSGGVRQKPAFAYVEQVYEERNFAALEIGA